MCPHRLHKASDGPRRRAVLDFWLEEVAEQDWYGGTAELDATIRDRFLEMWSEARAGGLKQWQDDPWGALAYIILTDQLPRNMFRGNGQSFATDHLARAASQRAIHLRWDLQVPEPARQFFYLPMMHSESTMDQDRAVRLMLTRMPETGRSNLLHARAHREIIRRFGRFPYRNALLGRKSRPDEEAFLAAGGYGAMVSELMPQD